MFRFEIGPYPRSGIFEFYKCRGKLDHENSSVSQWMFDQPYLWVV